MNLLESPALNISFTVQIYVLLVKVKKRNLGEKPKTLYKLCYLISSMTSYDVAGVTVRLGDHDIHVNHEVRHIEKKVKRVVRHKGFDMRTLVSPQNKLHPNIYYFNFCNKKPN